MRKNSLLLLTMVLTVFLAGSVWAADVTLQVESKTLFTGTTGNTLNLLMDNTGVDIAACQVDLLFDKAACFSITAVAKTSRSTGMDIFNFSQITGGIRIAMTGIGHKIDPGTGSVATLTVNVAEGCAPGDYPFDVTGCVVADPLGVAQNCIQVDNPITVSVPVCIPELNATTFNLGAVRLNGSATAALTIENVGTAAGAVTITGATAAPASFNLAVGATQAVTLTFTPAALGAFSQVVTIAGCGEDVTVTLTGTGVCSQVATNCPLAFGDVTVVETKTLPMTINNPGTAALNISAINFSDPDFTTTQTFPLVIAAGGNATVNVTVTPSAVEGLVTETATIVSDACAGAYVCTMTVNKMTPPYVILYVDPACQVIKHDVPFDIQVKIRQVTAIQPITAIHFELCLPECFASFDVASITMATGKSVIDSMGWKLQYHYQEPWMTDPDCLEIILTGGTPLTIDGCLINLHIVPTGADWAACGYTDCGLDQEFELEFSDVLINEGAPDYITESAIFELNEGAQWSNGAYNVVRTEGYPNDPVYTFDPACFDGGDFCFTATDGDGDEMFVSYIRDADWAAYDANAALPQIVSTTQTGVVKYVAPFPCGGLSTVVWCWHWAPDKDWFVATFGTGRPLAFQDTIIVASSRTWPSAIVCYDTTVVNYTLEQLDAYAVWETIESYPCAGPEPLVNLCADEHYYASITALGAADGGIYSLDMILDYDCTCLEPYEVGMEGLLTEDLGALTYTINEELCLICVSIALNEPLESEALCVPVMYVGFQLNPAAVNPICKTGYQAELSIEHVKINEANLTACWANGWIEYIDFEAAGSVTMSDYDGDALPDEPLEGVVVEVLNDCDDETPITTLLTDENGLFDLSGLPGCESFCFKPTKDMIGEDYIDDFVTAQDASWILRSLCHQLILTHDQMISADVTCDGNVTAFDAATLLRWIVGYPVEMCIGGFVFEPECICVDAPYTTPMVFEAALIGDVTGNYAGTPKSVVTSPEMTFKGNNANITINGVYSAVLVLNGVTASNVTVNGMECQWLSDGNVTKIAVANATPVDAVVSVQIASGSQVELAGNVNEVSFATTTAKIPAIPADFSLSQNYPNPFNPTTNIEFALPITAQVKVSVYNVLGQVVMDLVNGELEAGYHSVQWDASQMASGVYFYRIDAGNYTATRSMILMK